YRPCPFRIFGYRRLFDNEAASGRIFYWELSGGDSLWGAGERYQPSHPDPVSSPPRHRDHPAESALASWQLPLLLAKTSRFGRRSSRISLSWSGSARQWPRRRNVEPWTWTGSARASRRC